MPPVKIILQMASTSQPTSVLQKYAGQFLRLAFDGPPHVLMRAFAVETALALNSAFQGAYTDEAIVALKNVNCGRLHSGKMLQRVDSPARRDHIGYELDLKPYWFKPLGRVFGVSVDAVTDQVVQWVSKDCVRDARSSGGEPRREQFRRQRASPYKSDQPAVDNHEFYLAYHAMFCVAGELLSEHSIVIDRWESNVFDSWLRRHRLARNDGTGWLIVAIRGQLSGGLGKTKSVLKVGAGRSHVRILRMLYALMGCCR
ncbi:MAG: hypothetical protein IPJ38_15695 [Dechloromonas sp.]|uniref:Uncharacterized protein n=1 Tax=Candidatus Dechloromonas phosphorivorans TaxID=2899244 RepID=A0A935K666_9RHOO|nr:hypothetical protein [Candidatus Dechloromonas phosphorivorans]